MTAGHRLAACASTIVLACLGCSHMIENRAINAFSAALAEDDLGELQSASSPGFRRKALRTSTAIHDLEVLRLPTGEVSIVSVEDESETQKNVTVTIGESKQKLLYRLTKNSENAWVVDDILVRQKRRGHVATRSVTEQMDLLLSVREFLDAWAKGGRDEVLAVTGPELRAVLEALPPAYLARLTERITVDAEKTGRPDAQLDGDRARVTLKRASGSLVIVYRQNDAGAWRVTDVILDSSREADRVASLLKRATALATAVRFLESYNADDKVGLESVTTASFFERSLEASDLSSVELPRPALATDTFELTMQAHRADFVIPTATDVVKVSLLRQDEEDARGLPPVYRVEETTLYEVESGQEKRLSALFTSHASMQIFAEALRQRNLPILRHTSTADFKQRVWDRLNGVGLEGFPLVDVADTPPQILDTVFNGAVTEITVTQGPRAMTYVLRGRDADLLVDDVLVPATGRPASLKKSLEYIVPAYLVARGIAANDLSIVRRSSSDDFNRLVWNQVRTLPATAQGAPRFLAAPPTAILPTEEGGTVVLGSDRLGARVTLLRERGYLVVDEVLMIAGPQPEQRIGLKHRLRTEVVAQVAAREPVIPPSRLTMTALRPTAPSGPPASAPSRVAEALAADRPGNALPEAESRTTFAAPVELTPELGDLPLQ